MSEIKHTPGPWRRCGGATPYYSAIHSDSGYIVFGMADREEHKEGGKKISAPDMWEQLANASLIAASPDLLSALKRLCDYADAEYVPNTLFDIARAAIEKAERT